MSLHNVKRGLKIIPVSMVDEVISLALTAQPVPVNLEDDKGLEGIANAEDDERDEVVTH